MVRASLGAMSTMQEVDTFVSFLNDAFVEKGGRMHRGMDSPVLHPEMERRQLEPAYSVG